MANKVILIRGLPGVGKSYYVIKTNPTALHCFSADRFWMKDGGYNFDPKRIGEAHAWCFHKYLECIRHNAEAPINQPVIVDNTNISAYEISPYLLAASAYGYESEIITIWADPVLCCQRNVHNVPAQVIMAMYQRLVTETLPPFWNHKVVYPEG